MTSIQKKFTLESYNESNEGYTISILSSLPGYTLCWHINKLLNFNLIKIKDLELILKPTKLKINIPDLFDEIQMETDSVNENISIHNIYKYQDESLFANFYLIENKGTKSILWPEMKKVNYFFTFDIIPDELNVEELLFQLNNITTIEMAYEAANYCITDRLQLAI